MLKMIQTVDRTSAATADRGFYAPEQLGRSRRLTPEGYLVCEGVPIARTGMQLYHETDLNHGGNAALKGDRNGIISVQRTAEEVFRPETVSSFEGKSITIEHPPEFIGPHNRKEHEVGHVQNVRRGDGSESDLLVGDLLLKDPEAIAYVNRELPQLSSGYDAGYEQDRPGQATQTHIIGNHVALVKRGRAGPRVAVRDSISTGASSMTQTHDSILSAVESGKIINLATIYNGEDLKPRVDRLIEKHKALVTPLTPPNILEAEGPGAILNPGITWEGELKPLYERVNEARKTLGRAVDAVTWAGNLAPQYKSVLDGLESLERAVDSANQRKTAITRDAATRGAFGPVVAPAELNKQSREFYDSNSPRVTPAKGPITIAEMNRQSAEFYR